MIRLAPKRLRVTRLALALSLLAASSAQSAEPGADALTLLMFDRPGCEWCARWEEEIGPIYPRTAEGRCAPVTRLGLRDPLPEGVSLETPPRYTPTFVLLEDGREVGRIQGYPGQDFFWPLLAQIIDRADPGCLTQEETNG